MNNEADDREQLKKISFQFILGALALHNYSTCRFFTQIEDKQVIAIRYTSSQNSRNTEDLLCTLNCVLKSDVV